MCIHATKNPIPRRIVQSNFLNNAYMPRRGEARQVEILRRWTSAHLAFSYVYCWVTDSLALCCCIEWCDAVADASAPSAEAADKASLRTTWCGVHVSRSTTWNASFAASAASNCRPASSSTSSTILSSSVKMTSSPANFRRQQVPHTSSGAPLRPAWSDVGSKR